VIVGKGAGRTVPMQRKAIPTGATLIVLAAFLSFVLSVTLWFTNSRDEALFTGLWVPSILAVGAFYAALQGRRS
jgi:hypothetical protein